MKRTLLFVAAVLTLFAVACSKEKVDPLKPSVSWESNPGFGTAEMTSGLDAVVTVNAPGKFQDLQLVLNLGSYNILANQYIKIESNKSKSGSNPVLDLVADDSCVSFMSGLGMRVGASLKSYDTFKLDLKKILERILTGQIVENNSSFTIEIKVTDQTGGTLSKSARFHYTAAPTLTWEKNASFGEVLLDADKMDCKVKVWAPGKIDKLTVKLESGSDPLVATFIKNRTSDSSTTMDLVTDAKVSDGLKGYFPAPSAIAGKDQAILDFAFMYDWSFDMGASLNVFTITVVDQNGKEVVEQVKFRKN